VITIYRKQVINTKSVDPHEDMSQDKTFSEINVENVIKIIDKGVSQIEDRLNLLSTHDHKEVSRISQLIQLARNSDHLCRMDPIWFPNF
jgi:transformation/transcription domain-associated protein